MDANFMMKWLLTYEKIDTLNKTTLGLLGVVDYRY